MDFLDYLPILGIVVSVMSLFYMVIRNKFKDVIEVRSEMDNIKERLTCLEIKVTPFWNWIDKNLPNILHSPHTPEFDELLEKYRDDKENMSIDQLKRLMEILNELIHNKPNDKLILYVLMLSGVDSYYEEILNNGGKKC
jgi:hypothetical protein